MAEIKRIYPEARLGLINWIEENFQEIEQFVASFKMDDGQMYTFYDTYSFLEAMGLTSIAHADINRLGEEGEFVKKITPRPERVERGENIFQRELKMKEDNNNGKTN